MIADEYDGVESMVSSPEDLTYLDVRLRAGDRWRFTPPKGHNVGWVASHEGLVPTPGAVLDEAKHPFALSTESRIAALRSVTPGS